MKKMSWHRLLGFASVVMLVLTSCFAIQPGFRSDVVDPVMAAPEISMIDHNGNLFRMSAMQGKVVLLFFGFTNCVEECPLTMAHIKVALGMLGDKAEDVRVVLVSTDPVRDTPMALQDFLGKFDSSYIGIPGTVDGLKNVWDAYGIVVLNGGETHSSFTYVIDRGGSLRLRIEAEADPKDMASDIETLLSE